MNKERRCPMCDDGFVNPVERVVETKLAGITVRDGSQRVDTCSACGEGFFPALMLMGYEVRAVMTVLGDAPERADGSVLRYARRVLGLKQDELAKLLGLTVTTIVRMEKAKTIEARVRTSMLWYLNEAAKGVSVRDLATAQPKKRSAKSHVLKVRAA
jgi:hypothetical protein